MEDKQLIFIFNVNSDVYSTIKDSIAKVRNGKSACSLCTATWNAFNVKPSWRDREKKIKIPFVYYHRDDMPKEVSKFVSEDKVVLPTVLIRENTKLKLLVSNEHLDRCEGNDDCVWNLLESSGVV